jgi:hypothetical protein
MIANARASAKLSQLFDRLLLRFRVKIRAFLNRTAKV